MKMRELLSFFTVKQNPAPEPRECQARFREAWARAQVYDDPQRERAAQLELRQRRS